MLKTAVKYIAVLTGLYIVAANASNVGQVITQGASGATGFEKVLQGRG